MIVAIKDADLLMLSKQRCRRDDALSSQEGLGEIHPIILGLRVCREPEAEGSRFAQFVHDRYIRDAAKTPVGVIGRTEVESVWFRFPHRNEQI